MSNKNLMIFGGIALAIGGYFLWKKKHESTETPATETSEEGVETSNFSGSNPKTLTQCVCKNGLRSVCASGDCTKCCGSYGVQESKRFMDNTPKANIGHPHAFMRF